MRFIINGEPKHIDGPVTVERLLKAMSIQPEQVVVEVNLAILKRAQHATTVVNEGDQIEIVSFVGGGS